MVTSDISMILPRVLIVSRRTVRKKKFVDFVDYDGHRHAVGVVEDTPLHHWFEDSQEDEKMEIMVNSYHHQGVKRLAQRFVPMAFAPDGLVEGFYDPDAYNPKEGKFIMGLQFHPERMRHPSSDNFDYPGSSSAYQEFVKAVIAHEKKLNCSAYVAKARKLNQELIAGSEFLEANTALSLQQENRLKQMGATVRNSSMYLERLMKNVERERVARIIMENVNRTVI